MQRIQRLFEFNARISQDERDRWAFSQAIYSAPRMDDVVLRTPACWRRKANVRGIRH